MSKTIDLFMWGFQEHFRVLFQHRAETAFKSINCPIKVKSLLVGLKVPESEQGHEVCVEPETGDWDPKSFADCGSLWRTHYETHPGHQVHYGDAWSNSRQPERIRRDSMVRAVKETLVPLDEKYSTRSFCGSPVRVSNYYVIPILRFDKSNFESIPSLDEPIVWDSFADSSLGLHYSLLERLLHEAEVALQDELPGETFNLFSNDTCTVVREAASNFCAALALESQDHAMTDSFRLFNHISGLSYEGAQATGKILIEKRGVPGDFNLKIALRKPVHLQDSRLVRKLIEMNSSERMCLFRGEQGIVGLGEPTSLLRDRFIVEFMGHQQWRLIQNDRVLINVAAGEARIPTSKLSKAEFESLAIRLFRAGAPPAVDKLWPTVYAAKEQRHGTIIVIADRAESETDRLAGQCLAIEPTHIDAATANLVTNIDGAIILDCEGKCHAIGAILDGKASEDSDMSRGARFNSAIRYVTSLQSPAMCIVISEDGYVDLLPKLRPQVLRSEIEKVVELLQSSNVQNYNEILSWLDKHRFYLNRVQCDIVNREIERARETVRPHMTITLVVDPFKPDPKMNDSYFLNE